MSDDANRDRTTESARLAWHCAGSPGPATRHPARIRWASPGRASSAHSVGFGAPDTHAARAWSSRVVVLLSPLFVGFFVTIAGASASPRPGTTPILVGRSIQGRPIEAYRQGDPHGRVVLVVGCIDGDEPAGIAIVDRLERLAPR